MISNEELTNLVVAYQEGKINKKLMQKALYNLAEHTYNYPSYHKEIQNLEEALNEAADLCLEKIKKFDPSRGKAFNFFTTIVGCYLRQAYRTNKNRLALVASYSKMKGKGDNHV